MAKALKVVGIVAGAVALVATGLGAVGVGAVFGASTAGIAGVATLVAGVANIGARLLTKPPPARGSVTDTVLDVEPSSPYLMGEGYFAGVMRHKVGYGPTIDDVPNPYLLEALALCVAGPIAGPITPQTDFGAVDSWFSGFLETDTRLGATPDTALVPPYGAAPGWSSSSAMSGTAAIAWNYRFDKEGERYASGLPARGVVAQWVKVYDPRKDSTQPGGSGSHRLGDETTYEWSENPALHAGTYAFGRYSPLGQGSKRIIGMGLPAEGIDWEGVSAWANDCEANNWRMFGLVFEPGDRWQNLRDICIAGGAEPLFAGAVLGFHWQRPRVALDTITEADLADGSQEVTAMQSWRDRLNTLQPRYLEPTSNWSLIAANRVQVSEFLTEDGEERIEDVPFNFVKDASQAAQLAAYWLWGSRELTPITLTLMPRLRAYRPGECLHLDLPQLGLDHDAVILRRQFDPATGTMTMTLMTETPGKHSYALGLTGTAPPTPTIGQTAQERDQGAALTSLPTGYIRNQITNSWVTDADPLDGLVQASENSITIEAHTRTYLDRGNVSIDGATLTVENDGTTAIAADTVYHIFYDDATRSGGTVSYKATQNSTVAALSASTPARHRVATIRTAATGQPANSGSGQSPPGWDPNEWEEYGPDEDPP
ncbi:MAG: hypothetical protein AAF494_00700 [Pseudomonadota bacterium]